MIEFESTEQASAPGVPRPFVKSVARTTSAVFATALLICCLSTAGASAAGKFTLSSPDLASGTFDAKFVLNGFGCTGSNISPALQWSNVPEGTKSLALQVQDKSVVPGSPFWHWTVYNIPVSAKGLSQGAGNAPANLPSPAIGGVNDFLDTGATGGNGNYGGPCPTIGDKPHDYVFTLYALAVDDVEAASGIPKTSTPDLHAFILNKGLGDKVLGKASFDVSFGR